MAEHSEAVVVKKIKPTKKPAATGAKKISYSDMIVKAITNQKEKKGSSRQAIMQYLVAEYKVDPVHGKIQMNKALARMVKSGKLLPGAQAGRSGAGCYKLSAEEKTAIKKMERLEAKKLSGVAVKKIAKKKTVGGKVVDAKKKVKKSLASKKKASAKKPATGKVMKKISKASVGAKVKKGSTKPKKVAKKAGANKSVAKKNK